MHSVIEKKITIHAPVTSVWQSLTTIPFMIKWMGGADFQLRITTTWEIGSPMLIKGFHHVAFENKGIVLAYTPERELRYNFLSSLSRLSDDAAHYTEIGFVLVPQEEQTELLLTLSNFPTEEIYQHLNFYWNTTLVILKKQLEQGA
ncbi:SRPBCC family protein [Chitinophaga nivalis]|uniref:SRPBCC domain-containing protein n=1 Tax=Chitinophaga nivalis TaxID=2991709 RepID=A0ABT3INC9_9BACT|nr:SRPBCC domain-containing protein [Chitinophaga nivalis]MCW3464815.1 SRPBCC domain-containing protein [Chitinophaga nivalis]MCW3485494.1 SRPBCC domain-containing protein [Chitinophaga nivalis]